MELKAEGKEYKGTSSPQHKRTEVRNFEEAISVRYAMRELTHHCFPATL